MLKINKILFVLVGMVLISTQYSFGQFGCGSAVAISDGYTSGTITTPGTAGSEDWVTSVTTCGESNFYYDGSDVYLFEYTTGSTAGESFSFVIEANVDWMAVGVFSTCSGTSLSGCLTESVFTSSTGPLGVCATSLAANTTYYIAVSRWGSPDNLDFEVVEFDVTESSLRPDDECATASAIDISQPYVGSTRCDYTPSASSPGGCGSIENDSWFKFTAGSNDSVIIDYNVYSCSNGDGVQLNVFSGSCGSLSEISGACVNPALGTGTWEFTGLTIGEEYYIRVDGFSGDLCTYEFDPVKGVAVVPPNDTCPDASTVVCGQVDTANIVLSTDGDAPPSCDGRTTGKGVWYKFTGAGDSLTITTVSTATTDFTAEIFVYTGACGALSCVGADTVDYTFFAANAVEYTIYVDGLNSEEGTVSIAFACPTTVGCDCSSPNCGADGLFADVASTTPLPGTADGNCYDPSPDLGVGVYTSCHTVTASADGTLGLLQGMSASGACVDDIVASRTFELYAVSAGACSGSPIVADVDVADQTGTYSSTFNPEWYSLTPNADYVVCITFTVNGGCELDYSCLEYYNASAPPTSYCNTIIDHNFDAGNDDWTGSGFSLDNSSFAGNSTDHWNLTSHGAYGSDESSTVTSGSLDFSGYDSLTLSMDLQYSTESGFDGMAIYYSTDGGTNWTIVGSTVDPTGTNWYNNTGVDGIADNFADVASDPNGWSGSNGAWETATITLPPAVDNVSNVQFQVRFGSDGGVSGTGVAFDNFQICGRSIGAPCAADAGTWD